ncbi:hypothetical protein [Actinomadura rupiterrae]|uniref:hypothetical protein n=1 Tax=Actinomadura rupiterrae TaxID=559627 RepID=UPI0020A26797|nr:hypothetical protein [Actinomadura rupiterrae]MCP2339164.1 hypothetical protein [Actinomadura rupiterrae]
MAALTTNVVPKQATRIDTLFTAASAGGDDCATGGGMFLLVKNTSGSAVTVTLAVPGLVDGDLTVANRTFSVAATTGEHCIPLTDFPYKNTSTGRANITYSATSGVTVLVVRVPTS